MIAVVLRTVVRGRSAPRPFPHARQEAPPPPEHKGARSRRPRRLAAPRSSPAPARSGPTRAAQRADPPLARAARAAQAATPTRAGSRLRRRGRPDEYASPRAPPRLRLLVFFPPPGGSEEPRFPRARAGWGGARRGRAAGEREREKNLGRRRRRRPERGPGAERVRAWVVVSGQPRRRPGQSKGGEGASAQPRVRAGCVLCPAPRAPAERSSPHL